jgi:hypothetical protein
MQLKMQLMHLRIELQVNMGSCSYNSKANDAPSNRTAYSFEGTVNATQNANDISSN